MRVIKRNTADGAVSRLSEAAILDRQVRIPSNSIHVADVDGETGDRGKVVRARVVRKVDAAMAAHPYELDVTELSPGAFDRQISEKQPEKQPNLPTVKSPEEVLAEHDQQWEVRLQQAVSAAREDGYARGSADAAARLETDFRDQHQALLADLKYLQSRWDEFLEKLEPALAELSFDIAQAVLDAPLPQNVKGVATRAITEAVEQMAGSAPIEILIHPVDFLRLQESGVVEQLESLHTGLRWEPRPDMKHGEWVVQSPTMTVRRLEEELLGTLRSRLGLLAVMEKERIYPK
jgi:flagellar assembly protein FliH